MASSKGAVRTDMWVRIPPAASGLSARLLQTYLQIAHFRESTMLAKWRGRPGRRRRADAEARGDRGSRPRAVPAPAGGRRGADVDVDDRRAAGDRAARLGARAQTGGARAPRRAFDRAISHRRGKAEDRGTHPRAAGRDVCRRPGRPPMSEAPAAARPSRALPAAPQARIPQQRDLAAGALITRGAELVLLTEDCTCVCFAWRARSCSPPARSLSGSAASAGTRR
jgi:hypothetical protein